jgi:N-acetylglucosaminyldiphosphoundecaprenol N-acetyl-beta-D-mannosaminyltransferase
MVDTQRLLDVAVAKVDYGTAVENVFNLIQAQGSGYVCAANVHMITEARKDSLLKKALDEAFMVTPDGMPLVWLMRNLGVSEQGRVYGPDLMICLCRRAEQEGISVGFYGGKEDTLERLYRNISKNFPSLKITYKHSPPFREISTQENEIICEEINKSQCKILFIGLGCPKQEKWMLRNKNNVDAIMIGVGAAFDFHAGTVRQAPSYLQSLGLEWLFRLTQEPRRLWKRYLINNTTFIFHLLKERIRK